MKNKNIEEITPSHTNTTRNSAIELLRIFSMISIVFCHFATHGRFDFGAQDITLPRLWWGLIEMGGNFGVDVFVLISGYFLINNSKVSLNFSKVSKFWGQVFFYSIVLFAIAPIVGDNNYNLTNILKVFFPITFSAWWFASTYFMLFLLHPYINKLLLSLEKKTYQQLLILLTICWCIIPTFTTKNFQANVFLEFVYLYTIAGYIKIHGFNNRMKAKHYFALFILVSILTYLSYVVFTILGTKIPLFDINRSIYFYGRSKLPTLLRAVLIFIAFTKLKPFYNNFINIIASATFGVYLLHDSSVLRKYLWVDLFKNSSFQESDWIILYSIGVCCLIYTVCTILDIIRQRLFEPIFMTFINKYKNKITNPLVYLYGKVDNLIFQDKQ